MVKNSIGGAHLKKFLMIMAVLAVVVLAGCTQFKKTETAVGQEPVQETTEGVLTTEDLGELEDIESDLDDIDYLENVDSELETLEEGLL